MMNFLKIIILLISAIHSVHANQPTVAIKGFGVPCAPAGISANINTFLHENYYGYLQGFIDMTVNFPYTTANGVVSGVCADTTPQLDVCFYNGDNTPPCDYHTFQIGDSHAISTMSTNPTLRQDPFLQNMPLTASMINADTLCLTMVTPYGQAPLVCKNVITSTPPPAAPTCISAARACVGVNYSQSIFNFSGSAIECVTDVLNNIFFDDTRCPSNEESYLSSLKAFASFQQLLQRSIGALLILYVMMFGFQMILNQDKFNLETVVKFVLKFVLVLYFSVGIGSYFNSHGQKESNNGMIQWGLPILREVTNDFTQMVFSASGTRDLCSFDISQYPPNKTSYALWDIVDCRIGAYLGVKSVYNLGKVLTNPNFRQINNTNYNNVVTLANGPDQLNPEANTSEFGFPTTIWLLMWGGEFVVALSMIIFLTIFFSIIIGFVSIYSVCLITLHVLVYISPIFIPLALFEKTKQYFDSWLKATVSCTLQPMVVAGFVALIITMYDDILFGPPASVNNPVPGCEFIIHQYAYSGTTDGVGYTQNYNAFEMVLPATDSSICTGNIGYKMIAHMLGVGRTSQSLLILSIPQSKDHLGMSGNAMLLMILSIVFYYFSSIIYDFAVDVTGGVSTKGTVLNAVEAAVSGLQKAGKAIANLAAKGAKGAANAGKKGAQKAAGAMKRKGGESGGAPKQGGGSSGGAPKKSSSSEA